jgi:hypothetical protein
MSRKNYIKINNNFKVKLIFNIGAKAGFFSEYNNMILAMIFCYQHQIKFTISSSDSNFKYKKGWTDYFLDFCDEVNDAKLRKFNRRMPVRYKYQKKGSHFMNIFYDLYLSSRTFFRKIRFRFSKFIYFRKYLPFYYTYELWPYFHSKAMELRQYDFSLLGINGNLRDVAHEFIKINWVYQPEVKNEINLIKNSLQLPDRYIGFHIRGGDKFIEYEFQEIEKYIHKAESLSEIRVAFVLTDDYSLFEQLVVKYNDWKFFTLCNSQSRGYFHDDFQKIDLNVKYNMHLKLFASVDLLADAEYFIGTWNSNVGMYLGMRMNSAKCFGVDFEEWCIW